jgi:hypothetical protein
MPRLDLRRLDLRRRALLAAACLAVAVSAGCGGGSGVKTCGLIPEGGCPIGRGGTCDDAECSALYDCIEGAWTLERACSPGAGGMGSGGAGAQTVGAGGCEGVTIDHPGETQGCTPDLQLPDCPAAAASSCRPCDTGCIDFFVCTEPGWEAVAYCDAEGKVILDP